MEGSEGSCVSFHFFILVFQLRDSGLSFKVYSWLQKVFIFCKHFQMFLMLQPQTSMNCVLFYLTEQHIQVQNSAEEGRV